MRNKARTTISPDIAFIKDIKKESNSALKTCMQCGACTVVCELSPGMDPFPRKEMMWASWGLKNKLLCDPDIWLCYQCGDCTAYCPRNVNPADVMASLRVSTILHYSRPRFLAQWMHKIHFLPLILLFPVLLISLILFLAGTFRIPEGPVVYSRFFPHSWLNASFSLLFFTSLGFMLSGIRSFWKDMKKEHPAKGRNQKRITALKQTLMELLSHRSFRKCQANRIRQVSHTMIFYGFLCLLAVTAFAIIAVIFFEYPLHFWHPVKILGNLAGISLLAACCIQCFYRLKSKSLHSSYFDWSFLVAFILLSLSGFLVEAGRFFNWAWAYHLYFFHLICVWYLILFFPYSKFAHMIYRFLAVFYSKKTGRI
jgi:quinone-modifying oxidoreductase, subunit QmoC